MTHLLACPTEIGEDGFEASLFPSEIRVLGEHFPEYYCDYLEQCTKQVLVDFFGPDFGQLCLDPYSELPLIEAIFPTQTPGLLRIAMFCEGTSFAGSAGRHMADLFNRWLVPGETLNIPCSLAVNFSFTAHPEKKFFLCHLLLSLESDGYLYRAKKEIADLISILKKTITCIAHLKKSLDRSLPDPTLIDLHLFEYASKLLRDGKRTHMLVARIAGLQYFFGQHLRQKILNAPNTRHLVLKIFPHKQKGLQIHALGILIGLSLIREGELFEEKHLLNAVRRLIPDAEFASVSFVSDEKGHEKIRLFYIEVKKANELAFSRHELHFLRTQLPKECRSSVETLIHPLFMPRNDEDLLRFSLQLCSELDDGPMATQMAIFFCNQTAEILCFSVILARIVEKQCHTTLFDSLKTFNERVECSDIEMRYPPCPDKQLRKEVISFTAKLPKAPYLRSDYAVDVLQARQEIVRQIQELFGPVRDYNGGLFETQLRAEHSFLTSLGSLEKREFDAAKNFFHSITPTLMQIILDTTLLKKIFLSLLNAMNDPLFSCISQAEQRHEVILLKSHNSNVKKAAQRVIEELAIPASKITYSLIEHGGESYLVLLHQNEGEKHLFLFDHLRENLWKTNKVLSSDPKLSFFF
jgi:hypothetical protein